MVALEADALGEGDDVGGHLLDGVGLALRRRRGTAVAAVVEDEDAVAVRELGDLMAPVGDVTGETVHENEGLAGGSVHLVVELDSVGARKGIPILHMRRRCRARRAEIG